MSERLIKCRKLGRDLPGLPKAPFSGELGQMIYNSVSAEAWKMWQDMQIKIINEYRLNLGSKADYERLLEQMQLFLNLKQGSVVEVENAERGRGNRE